MQIANAGSDCMKDIKLEFCLQITIYCKMLFQGWLSKKSFKTHFSEKILLIMKRYWIKWWCGPEYDQPTGVTIDNVIGT